MIFRRDPLADPKELLDRLYSYVAYVVGDGADAQDITSEAFERALRYRSSYDAKKGPPIGWLIGIARRVITARAGATWLSLEEEPWQAHDADPGGEADRALVVRAAVARLAPRDRELVALRFGSDLTAKQIGEVLGMETNTVEVALRRALDRLRTVLEPALRA
jgi:RNA polymerase sigma factor (sigma-70 family)